jgi:hypothetical protein
MYDEIVLKSEAGGVDDGVYENPNKILRTEASTNDSFESTQSRPDLETPEYVVQYG